MINLEITAKNNEPGLSVLRRFSSKARSLNIVRATRDGRFKKRKISSNMKKANKVKVLARGRAYDLAYKLGQIKGRR